MFFLSGKIVQRIEGAKAADVTKAVKSLAKVQPTPRSNNQSAKEAKIETPEELNERLKKIIGRYNAMVLILEIKQLSLNP